MGKLNLKLNAPPRADAVGGPYTTQLHPIDEGAFRKFVAGNSHIPAFANFNPDEKQSDYDMRGWWQAFTNPNHPQHELTSVGVSDYDGMPHFNDYWKTPYHKTFSSESRWAIPGKAPSWTNDGAGGWNLVNPGGIVMAREPKMMGD